MAAVIDTESKKHLFETDDLKSAVKVYLDLENKINHSTKPLFRVLLVFDNYKVSSLNSEHGLDYEYSVIVKDISLTYTEVFRTKNYEDALKVFMTLSESTKLKEIEKCQQN